MSNVQNVTAAKPITGGAVYVASVGTELPTDTKSKLNESFKALGYISEDGLTFSYSPETEEINAWGGDTVANPISTRPATFQYTLIESLNVDVLKHVYGADNVEGTLETGIKISGNSRDMEPQSLVVDMILSGDIRQRYVIPIGKLIELGETNYVDNDIVGYDVTVQGLPDSDGQSFYMYMDKPAGGESDV